jgi:hypothetical protein
MAAYNRWASGALQVNVYDYTITTLCRKQIQDIKNHRNENVCNMGQGEGQHRKYKRFKLGSSQANDPSSD